MAKKILLIEDDDLVTGLLSRRLKREGYEVDIARDGAQGLVRMKAFEPDLILLDMVMPERDGFEVMEEMQRDETLKRIPVIIVSNSGQGVELSRAKKLGAKDWLIKTEFDPAEVVDKVKKQLP